MTINQKRHIYNVPFCFHCAFKEVINVADTF
jgi:hypothetical protein